ncbi:MAG TPA: NAD(P)-binding domain-containing protein [Jiangellaceae bacterium]|nr:NAD(P)-binding domain-containing protein [Jiangellaceae bacterium]
MNRSQTVETVIVGGGAAGLAVGYHLTRRDRPFVVLDAHQRIGDSWRTRWDSLRLLTPARYSGLPGWPIPASPNSFPTKDEVADYLQAYADRFAMPIRTCVRVTGVTRRDGRYVVEYGDERLEADHVVVATGANRVAHVPDMARELDSTIVQLHSSDYRNPAQLADGAVLIVGAGNSGAEIALEVSRSHHTLLSGNPNGQVPFEHGPAMARFVFPVVRFVGHHVLTMRTPMGRRAAHRLAHGEPLIRVKMRDLEAAGVELLPRTAGAMGGLPVTEEGPVVGATTVIWCTGFRRDFGWIDLPVFGDDGEPAHERGVAVGEPGLFFVGLPFLYAKSSEFLPGMGRDAAHVARQIAARAGNQRRQAWMSVTKMARAPISHNSSMTL